MDKSDVDRRKILSVLKRKNVPSFYALFIMWGLCVLFYYFGELVDFFGWTALRWEIFYTVHDLHRLLFLVPIIYAGYVFGVKATIIVTIITLMVFLPRAIFLSPFPDPILRMSIFTISAGIMGYLTAVVRRETKQRNYLELQLIKERDRLLSMLERMEEGVLIIGPDYRIRYMNTSMIRNFGGSVGSFCYESLRGFKEPCREKCYFEEVIKGSTEIWEYKFPDGRIYELQASPYKDSDGVVCQLTIYRDITSRGKDQT